MAHVLIPLPARDVDPTEAAVGWRVLTDAGHRVPFATPDGEPAWADAIMLTGRGLDPWGLLPGLGRLTLIGRLLRADAVARAAWAAMARESAFLAPLRWDEAREADFGGLLLPGGHRAWGMRAYLESGMLQTLVAAFFAADKPVAAICHGVLLAARSRRADGRSVLHGRRTTALTWTQERAASALAHVGRWWDPLYYRTYVEAPGEPRGHMSVEAEVTRALAAPGDFIHVAANAPDRRRKLSGRHRDRADDSRPAFVVRDGNYISARWPGDAHAFAATFAKVLAERAAVGA